LNRVIQNKWPKGMEPPEALVESKKPAPLHLGRGNYVGAIRQALEILPVEIRVDRCLVLERDGRPPEVRLSLTILGEKEGYREWKRSIFESSIEDVCSERP